MIQQRITPTLRYEVIGRMLPLQETFRTEHLGITPDPRIMIGSIKVHQHPAPRFKIRPAPAESPEPPSSYKGKEGILPTHVLAKNFHMLFGAGDDFLLTVGMVVQPRRREEDIQGNGHGGAQD